MSEGDPDDAGEFLPLDALAFAARLGVSRATAYRRLEALRARQGLPGILRVQFAPAVIGFGAIRQKVVVLWPKPEGDPDASNDNAASLSADNDNAAAELGELAEGEPRPRRGRSSRSRRRRR